MCRRRPAARKSPPGTPSRPVAVAIGRQWAVHVVFVVDRNKQGRCFTRASPPVASGRLRSPPVASGRLRSPPVASGRLRSPPVASGRLRSPPVTSSRPHSPSACAMGLGLVQVVPRGVSVGRGALFQCTNAFWGLNHRSQGGWPRLEPAPGSTSPTSPQIEVDSGSQLWVDPVAEPFSMS